MEKAISLPLAVKFLASRRGGNDSDKIVEETTEVAAESATLFSDSNTN